MSTTVLTSFLQCLALLSIFLLIGVWLRAKVKLFQATFIPASVIGGFLLLIVGPYVLNILPFPADWMKTYVALPGVLIVPIVASVPLGLKLSKGEGKQRTNIIFQMVCIANMMWFLQILIGFGVNLGFSAAGMKLYDAFGLELSMGFMGGHGTAGLLGNMLQTAGLDYWQTAQGVAITMATIGLVGGILVGIVMINWAARTGNTHYLTNPDSIPLNVRVGYETNVEKQASIGRETTLSASIDALAFHAAVIFTVCGAAYLLIKVFKMLNLKILASISVWAYAIGIMFIVWYIIMKLKATFLIDGKVKGKISGSLTEFAVTAAIASMNLKAVAVYIVPIIVMSIIGMLATVFFLTYMHKKLIDEDWFEHTIGVFGQSTGVFITGLLLLRICDPEFKSNALADYGLAFTFDGLISFAIMSMFPVLIISYGAKGMFITSIIGFLVFLLLSGIWYFMMKGKMHN